MSVHVTKFAHPAYNPAGLPWSGMCVDASTVMAARLAGSDLAALGAARARSAQELLVAARRVALGMPEGTGAGAVDLQVGITIAQRGRVLDALGIASRHTDDVDELLAAAEAGRPVIWNGWARGEGTWHARLGAALVAPDGHHAVAVSRSPRTGTLVVNDPNSRVGPIAVTEAELRAFSRTPPADFPAGGTILG